MGVPVQPPLIVSPVFLVSSPIPKLPGELSHQASHFHTKGHAYLSGNDEGPACARNQEMETKCMFLIMSLSPGTRRPVRGHVSRGAQRAQGQSPVLTPGPRPGPRGPSEACPGTRGSHFSARPGRWTAWPKGAPRFGPLPSLSCLVPCAADGQVSPAELAPGPSRTCFPRKWGGGSAAGNRSVPG